jgi:hypothetical protein
VRHAGSRTRVASASSTACVLSMAPCEGIHVNVRFRPFSSMLLLSAALFPVLGLGQTVVQRGPLGTPAQVMDETLQWTTPLLVAEDHDVEIYIPDVSSPAWLKGNYPDFQDKGQYVLSMFTLYKTPKACQANQIAWGNGDGEHLDACNDIGYRVRQATVDSQQKTVTLMMAAMVDPDGQILSGSIRHDTVTRTWAQLDANTQTALEKATALIAQQMRHYDRKQQGIR